MVRESQSFALEQQRVVAALDAKATALNDKATAFDAMLVDVENKIRQFGEDGKKLGTNVDEGLERIRASQASQMQIVAGEFVKFEHPLHREWVVWPLNASAPAETISMWLLAYVSKT